MVKNFRHLLNCLALALLLPATAIYAQQSLADVKTRLLPLGENLTTSVSLQDFPEQLNTKKPLRYDYYEFSGGPGEYVEISCKQDGSDIRMVIVTPDGKPIATIDSFSGAYGPEVWRGLLTQSGRYIVQVDCLSARSDKAHYQIKLSSKRPPDKYDLLRAEAQDLYCQAWLRRQAGSSLDNDEAFYLYDKAVDLFRQANDLLGQAQSLESQATLGQPTLTEKLRIEKYRDALSLFHRLREPSGEANTVHSLALIYADHNRRNDAVPLFQQALDAYRAIGDRRGEALVLNHLALIYVELSLPLEAMRYYKLALTACRQSGDRTGEAALLKYIGDLYQQMGQNKEAERFYKQSDIVTGVVTQQ